MAKTLKTMAVRKEIMRNMKRVCKEASRSFNRIWKERRSFPKDFLETILYKATLTERIERIKANKGACRELMA